jgi:hypothetical protein
MEKFGTVLYDNKPYHRDCLKKYHASIVKSDYDDIIKIELSYRMTELINLTMDMWDAKVASGKTHNLLTQKLMSIICNHNSDYIQCCNPNCRRLILRKVALVGEKTKEFQQILIRQQSEQDIKPDDVDYKANGKAHRVLYFCSNVCDGYYASKLRNNLSSIIQNARKEIEEIKDRTTRTISVYSNSQTRSKDEVSNIQKILESQMRVKIKNAETKAVMEVKKVTKEWIG